MADLLVQVFLWQTFIDRTVLVLWKRSNRTLNFKYQNSVSSVNFEHFVSAQGPHLASVQEGLEESKAGRLLFLWYEDMKADLPNAIRLDPFSAVCVVQTKNIRTFQNSYSVLGRLPDRGAGVKLGRPAEHQEDEVQPRRQP